MDYLKKILIDFELHSEEGIRECFEHGVNPNDIHDGKPLIYALRASLKTSIILLQPEKGRDEASKKMVFRDAHKQWRPGQNQHNYVDYNHKIPCPKFPYDPNNSN